MLSALLRGKGRHEYSFIYIYICWKYWVCPLLLSRIKWFYNWFPFKFGAKIIGSLDDRFHRVWWFFFNTSVLRLKFKVCAVKFWNSHLVALDQQTAKTTAFIGGKTFWWSFNQVHFMGRTWMFLTLLIPMEEVDHSSQDHI